MRQFLAMNRNDECQYMEELRRMKMGQDKLVSLVNDDSSDENVEQENCEVKLDRELVDLTDSREPSPIGWLGEDNREAMEVTTASSSPEGEVTLSETEQKLIEGLEPNWPLKWMKNYQVNSEASF